MVDAISETYRRRRVQNEYNIKHNMTPTTILSSIKEISIPSKKKSAFEGDNVIWNVSVYIKRLELEMDVAAANLDYERAAEIRDELFSVKKRNR